MILRINITCRVDIELSWCVEEERKTTICGSHASSGLHSQGVFIFVLFPPPDLISKLGSPLSPHFAGVTVSLVTLCFQPRQEQGSVGLLHAQESQVTSTRKKCVKRSDREREKKRLDCLEIVKAFSHDELLSHSYFSVSHDEQMIRWTSRNTFTVTIKIPPPPTLKFCGFPGYLPSSLHVKNRRKLP